jgi:hypothetical protein
MVSKTLIAASTLLAGLASANVQFSRTIASNGVTGSVSDPAAKNF